MSATPLKLNTAAGSVLVFPDRASASRAAGDALAHIVGRARSERGRAVLGLATGGTPIGAYERLVELHRLGELSFENTSSYNLDEYYPMSPLSPRSYRAFMDRHLFSQVDWPANRTHLLDGTVPEAFVSEHCAQFERWIEAEGGLDVQLLGIGRNGHIGFNEPSELSVEAALALRTRMTPLHPVTVADAVPEFGGDASAVPGQALTMGVATILAARSIVILAFGEAKAEAVQRAIEGPVTASLPASLLQTVKPRVTWYLDRAAAARLRAD